MSRSQRQRAKDIANKAMRKYKDEIELAQFASSFNPNYVKDIGGIDVKIPRGSIDVSPDLFQSFINKAADRVGIDTKSVGIDFGEIAAGVPLPPHDPAARGPHSPIKIFSDWPGGPQYAPVGPSRTPDGLQWHPPTPPWGV